MKINLPLTKEVTKNLKAGDIVELSGIIYTARDAAHKRLIERLDANEPLPFDLKDSIIYYVGPTPEKPGAVIGSAGPTTSYRMDAYAPTLLDLGLKGMIGKGPRNHEVIDAMKRNDAVYFAAVGGAAALLALHIKEAEVIAFDDLGPEAIRKLKVKNMPLVVVIDHLGNDLYEIGRKNYLKKDCK